MVQLINQTGSGPYQTDYLKNRIRELIAALRRQQPSRPTVPGAEGNLIRFDPMVIDAYALRHADAQRYPETVELRGVTADADR